MSIPRGSTAVMARRVEPADSLDYFPTHPWATRALLAELERRGEDFSAATCWEPACGEGYMALPLQETFARVYASDIFDYSGTWPGQDGVCNFLEDDAASSFFGAAPPDWIITNPPFNDGAKFALQARRRALRGVAMFVRVQFLECLERYRDLFGRQRPALILQFSERVPLLRGRCDPRASTATAYCWIVWIGQAEKTEYDWLPPGQATRFFRASDYRVGARPRVAERARPPEQVEMFRERADD